MRTQPAFINDNGDMSLHIREGGVAVFTFEDENGDPRDMSQAAVFFELKTFRRQLQPGTEANQLILSINRGELDAFMNKRSKYIIVDETGTIPHIIMDGYFVVRGWDN